MWAMSSVLPLIMCESGVERIYFLAGAALRTFSNSA
ncbi:MAG: hypothetical protein RLZZ612_1441, partial [Pseudomonadota bacterium]